LGAGCAGAFDLSPPGALMHPRRAPGPLGILFAFPPVGLRA
jgi:hypothetical protein